MSEAKEDAGRFASAMNGPHAPLRLTVAIDLAETDHPWFHSFSIPDGAPRTLNEATFIFGGNRDAWEVYRTVQDFWAVRRFGS